MLVGYLGLFLAAWVWDLDLALFRFMSDQPVWTVNAKEETYVTVGNVMWAAAVLMLLIEAAGAAWRLLVVLVNFAQPDSEETG